MEKIVIFQKLCKMVEIDSQDENIENQYEVILFDQKFTPLEIQDCADAISIWEHNCLFELMKMDRSYLDELWDEINNLDQAGKKLILALFCDWDLIVPLLIIETDPRILAIMRKREQIEKEYNGFEEYLNRIKLNVDLSGVQNNKTINNNWK